MKKLLFTTFIICLAAKAFCQQTETEAVKATINTMFDAMRKGDSVMLNKTFHKSMVLQSVANKKDGTVALITEKPEEFAKAVGTPTKRFGTSALPTVL